MISGFIIREVPETYNMADYRSPAKNENVTYNQALAVLSLLTKLYPTLSVGEFACQNHSSLDVWMAANVAAKLTAESLAFSAEVLFEGSAETIQLGIAYRRIVSGHEGDPIMRIVAVVETAFGIKADGTRRWKEGEAIWRMTPVRAAVSALGSELLSEFYAAANRPHPAF